MIDNKNDAVNNLGGSEQLEIFRGAHKSGNWSINRDGFIRHQSVLIACDTVPMQKEAVKENRREAEEGKTTV